MLGKRIIVSTMKRKHVIFIANSLDNAYRFQQILAEFDVEIAAGSTLQIKRLFSEDVQPDLAVFEARGSAWPYLEEIETLAGNSGCSLLLIVDEQDVMRLELPSFLTCDFLVDGATKSESAARIRRLLGETGARMPEEMLVVDNMTINLATYQVIIAGKPVDFTYLEYALLSYLVQHPNRTYSRDALLLNVWGFDYYGGSRTVDVHVRRIRAKLGPSLAQHLETVRGVGYLWSLR